GGLQVDDQLVFGRRLHGQISGLLPLEDAVDVTGCLSELVNDVRPVRDQAPTGPDIKIASIDSGQLVAGSNGDDEITLNRRGGLCDDEATIRGAGEGRNNAFEFAGIINADADRAHLTTDGLRCVLDSAEHSHSGRIVGITNDSYSRHARRDLLEKLQPFRAQTVLINHEAGSIAARPR